MDVEREQLNLPLAKQNEYIMRGTDNENKNNVIFPSRHRMTAAELRIDLRCMNERILHRQHRDEGGSE